MVRALQMSPLPVTFLIFCLLCPTELSVFVGSLRLPPHRVVLIVLFGFAIVRLFTARNIRVSAFDIAFVAFNAWVVVVMSYHDPDGDGFIFGGSMALESLGAYLVARAYVRDVATLRAVLKVMLLAIIIAALLALPETLGGQIYVHDFLYYVTGYYHPTSVHTRLGLTRAFSTFDHPIHYGTFCAGLFALLWYSQPRASTKRMRAAIVSGATFLGISSAPILCLWMQVVMIFWERVTRSIPSRTTLSIAVIAGLLIGLSIVSSRSVFTIIATRLTLDSWTGFYRIQIWEHGMNNVWASPWLGIGLADWVRPWWMASSTIDAFWLVIAMRTGIPGFLLLALAIGLLAYAVVSRRFVAGEPERRRIVLGWMMSLIALCLVAVTVHFWNVLYAYFFFFLGLGGVLADPYVGRKQSTQRRAPVSVRDLSYAVREGPLPSGAAPGYAFDDVGGIVLERGIPNVCA